MAAAQMGLGGLLGGLGEAASLSSKLLAILKSRSLAERMIEKHDLMKVLYAKLWDEQNQRWKIKDPKKIPTMEDAVKTLFSQVSFIEDKKSKLIIIKAEMSNPQIAAEIVNGYLAELTNFINKNAFTMAKRNRIFIEGQLERNKVEFLESGKQLSSFYSTNKISNIVPTVDVNMTIPIPDEIMDVQRETENLQKKLEETHQEIQEQKVVSAVPQQVYLQYLTLRRELLGKVNALLTQQYEMAKIEEAKEELNFQVIDWAKVPMRKYKPKRAQIVMITFVLSLFLSVFYVFSRDYLQKIKGSRPKT